MPRVCAITGKKTVSQTTSKRKGSPKKRGGVGLKQVGVHKRTFKPNLVKKTLWVGRGAAEGVDQRQGAAPARPDAARQPQQVTQRATGSGPSVPRGAPRGALAVFGAAALRVAAVPPGVGSPR